MLYRCTDADVEFKRSTSRRGKHKRGTAKREAVQAHILSHNPTISHYRREHAPNRLYLPSDLCEKRMHQEFSETCNMKVSYAFYCRVMKDMNISLVKLGHEQCECCVAAIQHRKQSGHQEQLTEQNFSCAVCVAFTQHIRAAGESRSAYREDGEIVSPKTVVLAVDLQKVIQIPRLEGLKSVVFFTTTTCFQRDICSGRKVFTEVSRHCVCLG
ncbi:uncharacterized protein LOC131678587 [Topomyia yanbarensis]|uniref:uncharacterized protein LOC131678587 n=1 Tax=Topomyia yanbarensis TaxID=2498891 RepID=UPI00273B9AE1|nr:uncharacterized protein LOC131678587 [Topomyia yanbarensis]